MALSSPNLPSSPPVAAQRQSPSARDRDAESLITYCCVCYLPVASAKIGREDTEEGPPFWLTSCGHIVCGSHVFPGGVPQDAAKTTHTCPYCSSGGISLADLGAGKVSLELRDYFRPESDLLEDVAGAIKFRMSNAIRIASHYKTLSEKLQSKVDDQRRVLLKVKDELIEGKELKKEKSTMETEITNLRQENSQLRAQLSSAQLSSLDYDGVQLAQRQCRSSTETLQQNSISPVTAVAEIENQHKRKADYDPVFRAREFRNEMNKRQAMPPPAIPQPASRVELKYRDSERKEKYNEQRQDQHQEQRVDKRSEKYNDQFQQLDYSLQRQHIQDNQSTSRGASNQHGGQANYQGRQLIDLTETAGSSINPPPLPNPRDGFLQQQKPQNGNGNGSQSRAGYVPFRPPLKAGLRPVSSLQVRGTRDGYFASPQRTGAGYGGTLHQSFHKGNSFRSSLPRTEHLSPFAQQGGNTGNFYGRGGQEQFAMPSTPRVTDKGGGNVISPFFADIPSLRGSGLPGIGDGIQRPASVASFGGQQGPYRGSLGDRGFFIRQNNRVEGASAAVEVRQGGGGLGSIFKTGIDNAAGGGAVDRPGLRSVRRD